MGVEGEGSALALPDIPSSPAPCRGLVSGSVLPTLGIYFPAPTKWATRHIISQGRGGEKTSCSRQKIDSSLISLDRKGILGAREWE